MTIDASVALITPSEAFGSLRYLVVLAERGGFEPPIRFRVYYLSKVARSTTLPSLRNFWIIIHGLKPEESSSISH